MKLNNKDYKRFLELKKKASLTDSEKKELAELQAKKDSKGEKEDWKPGNDFAWWNKIPTLTKDAVNLPLNWIPGTALTTHTLSGDESSPASALRIAIQNTYGSEDSPTGPFNMMARNLYLAMHRNYRGLNAYQASDIAITIIATIELISLIARVERVYGVINRYSLENRSLPYALLASMNVSTSLANNIREHLADFRYGLNRLIMKAQNVCIPKDFSVLSDKISLFGYVYKDHDSVKAQSIVFDTHEVGVYRGDATTAGGGVVYESADFGDFSTYEEILSVLDTAISALVEDSDVLRIYSDFVSYLKPESLLSLVPVPENFMVGPVYSEEILHKIHNLYSTGNYWEVDDDGGKYELITDAGPYYREFVKTATTMGTGITKVVDRVITQYDNVVITKGALYGPSSGGGVSNITTGKYQGYTSWSWAGDEVLPCTQPNGQVFDTYRVEPDPATMLEGSLFKFFLERVGTRVHAVSSVAWEIVVDMKAYITINGTTSVYTVTQFDYISGYNTGMSVSEIMSERNVATRSMALLSQFDWAPIYYLIEDDDVDSLFFGDIFIHGDVDNCRMVNYSDVYRMHEVAVYSGLESAYALIKE